MSVFLLIIFSLPVLALLWWRWADGRLRGLGLPGVRRGRILLAFFMLGTLALYAWVILARRFGLPGTIPTVLLGLCYIWHLLVLPLAVLLLAGGGVLWGVSRAAVGLVCRTERRAQSGETGPPGDAATDPSGPAESVSGASAADPPEPAEAASATPAALTRRQLLAAACVALPPVTAVGGQAYALFQLRTFRIRPLEIWLPALPPALDGLTIAHVSDVHVGRFTGATVLRALVARTRALQADLVLFTGDLIDHALADLPDGVAALRQLAPPERLYLVEGNHDLFESRAEFERQVRAAGLNLLLNESATVVLRGQRVQLLGLRWGRPDGSYGARFEEQLERVLPLRDPAAFPILLAHHPHVFDAAAAAGLPLTLSGHTHGGQLMLTERVGAGPVLFKYCSGLYRRGAAALVVSNGVGNWFPLRIHAPAEVLHLTLRAGTGVT